jgi:N-acetylglucosaminyldiphosphoundecaprenol N-acetyl-beta-D-mannosaminyltransferase
MKMRKEFLGTPVDLLTFDQTVKLATQAMRSRVLMQHVALNVAKLVKMRSDQELRRDVTASQIIGIDGMGVVWGARALGIPVPERVAGVDLMERLLSVCAAEGFRPYFLGATQEVVVCAVAEAKRRWPRLNVAGYRNGYFQPSEEGAVVSAIQSGNADCLFVGMPTPRKERFLNRHRAKLGVPFIMGVGGGLDVFSGKIARAPAALQHAGLEWLFRIYQEPRRMWWRYARTNVVFAGLLGAELLRQRIAPLVSGGRA